MRILVTGSTGFIGTRLMETPQIASRGQGLQVSCWPESTTRDLLDEGTWASGLDDAMPDVVIHLAWRTTGSPDYEYDPANHRWAEATVALARYVASRGARFVGVGSLIEEDPRVQSEYARAKRVASEGLEELASQGRDVVWIRPSWVFDFASLRPRVLASRAQADSTGTTFQLRTPGERLDFVHVTDVARGVAAIATSDMLGTVALASGRALTVGQFIQAFDDWRGGSDAPPPVTGADHTTSEARRAQASATPTSTDWAPYETERLLGRYW